MREMHILKTFSVHILISILCLRYVKTYFRKILQDATITVASGNICRKQMQLDSMSGSSPQTSGYQFLCQEHKIIATDY